MTQFKIDWRSRLNAPGSDQIGLNWNFMKGRRAHLCWTSGRGLVLTASVVLLAVSGCALPHDTSLGREWGQTRLKLEDTGGKVRSCTEAFAVIDDAVDRGGTRDAQAVPVAGFPHLRTTRFLAALAPQIEQNNDRVFDFWTGWLADTATKARGYELANLPQTVRAALHNSLGKVPEAVVKDCTAVLGNFDKQHKKTREILARTVNAPDNYIDLMRVIGIYPLTAIPVLIGFNRWKQRNLPSFARPPSDLKPQGAIIHFAPPTKVSPMRPEAVAALLRRRADNPLKIPRPIAAELRRLAAAFAPVFSIDVTGDYDRIGAPILAPDGAPGLDTRVPRVYVQHSWAMFGGAPVFQISYLAWFSERPPTGGMDILAGRLDGVIWRVTIAPDGRPILYDSIHPCGCYHLFFPAPPTRLKDHPIDEPDEGTMVPIDAPALGPGQRLVLHIGSGNHYLRALSVTNFDALDSTPYELVSMDVLRSLPLPTGGTRSMYDQRGIVVGTDRLERFLLWPMGISNPGAMRQWGTHATAFVGRRQFDDPYLLNRAFVR